MTPPANRTADFLTQNFLAVSSVYRIEIAAYIAEEYNSSLRRRLFRFGSFRHLKEEDDDGHEGGGA